MTVDPDPISERTETVPRREMKMNDVDSMGKTADVGSEIEDMLSS